MLTPGSDKEVWGEGTPWKNSVAFFTYLRGCLRKAWSRHPTRISVVNSKRKQIQNPRKGHRAMVWGFECEMCKEEFPIKLAQVDHIVPAGSLQKTSDIQGFVERLLYVTAEDLRLVCKGCNMALAYSDKNKVPLKLALITKKVIAMEKAKTVLTYLEERGIVPAKNAKQRRQQCIEEMMKCT